MCTEALEKDYQLLQEPIPWKENNKNENSNNQESLALVIIQAVHDWISYLWQGSMADTTHIINTACKRHENTKLMQKCVSVRTT